MGQQSDTGQLPLALFGAEHRRRGGVDHRCGATKRVRLVISRGGRPDLARDALPRVQAPTSLSVNGIRRFASSTRRPLLPYGAGEHGSGASGDTSLRGASALEAVIDLVVGAQNAILVSVAVEAGHHGHLHAGQVTLVRMAVSNLINPNS